MAANPSFNSRAPGREAERARADAPDGGEESTGEPVQGQAGELCGAEPGHITEFTVSNRRDATDDFSFVDRGDMGGAVTVGLGDLVVAAAEHIGEPQISAVLIGGGGEARAGQCACRASVCIHS